MNITENFFTLLPAYLSRRIERGSGTGELDIKNALKDFVRASREEVEEEIYIHDMSKNV